MEYFLVFYCGVLTTAVISRIIYNRLTKKKSKDVLRQSSIYGVLKYFDIEGDDSGPRVTQATELRDNQQVRLIYSPDNKVYWMKKGVVYWTMAEDDGNFNMEDGQEVDFTNLSFNEVVELLEIISALQDG
jgi:hypothetical protein